jgi:hypothetical protein
MAMVCPRCATPHDERAACPGCGDQSHIIESHALPATNAATRWQHTPWGRILIGLLLAQGIFYGLRHLATGIFLAVRTPLDVPEETAAFWSVLLLQVLQAIALMAGGILAGSGQRSGSILGAVVGVWNGVLCGLTPQAVGQPLSVVGLYGDPIVQTALGALAGWFGGTIWRPLPPEEPREPRPVRKAPAKVRPPLFAGRVYPVRVSLGTAVAVCGSLGATGLYHLIEKLSDGGQAPGTLMLDQIVTWEIKVLALIGGGVIAGANTRNGLKQGLAVGILTALVLAGVEPSIAGRWVEATTLLFLTSLSFCLLGSWFGSQLFPPVLRYRRRLGAESMV